MNLDDSRSQRTVSAHADVIVVSTHNDRFVCQWAFAFQHADYVFHFRADSFQACFTRDLPAFNHLRSRLQVCVDFRFQVGERFLQGKFQQLIALCQRNMHDGNGSVLAVSGIAKLHQRVEAAGVSVSVSAVDSFQGSVHFLPRVGERFVGRFQFGQFASNFHHRIVRRINRLFGVGIDGVRIVHEQNRRRAGR